MQKYCLRFSYQILIIFELIYLIYILDLTDTTTPDQRESRCMGNKGVKHIAQRSQTEALSLVK